MEARQGRRHARGTGSPTAGGSCPDSLALSYNLCSSFAYHGPPRRKSGVASLAVVHQRAFENPPRVQFVFVHSSSSALNPRAGSNHAANLRPARAPAQVRALAPPARATATARARRNLRDYPHCPPTSALDAQTKRPLALRALVITIAVRLGVVKGDS
jgi:hypothetical protein